MYSSLAASKADWMEPESGGIHLAAHSLGGVLTQNLSAAVLPCPVTRENPSAMLV